MLGNIITAALIDYLTFLVMVFTPDNDPISDSMVGD
jgi:hypothetical protein